jgi:hypothetical protein
MKYIFVYFLPGCAGNFFGRCLNLLNNAYCFVDRNTPKKFPTSIDSKINLLSYNSMINKSFEDRVWTVFEHQAAHYHTFHPHWQLPDDSYSVWIAHPNKEQHASLAGPNDVTYSFYIDSSDCFEWGVVNALYKNSYLDVQWFINGNKLKNDPSVHKINLNNIIGGEQSFLDEFVKVCDIINHQLSSEEESAIKSLYQQWIKTTLSKDNICDFKNRIGFLM